MSVTKILLLIICSSLLALGAHARPAVGTVALYSDGSVEKLVAYDGNRAVWEDTRKRRYTYGNNPLSLVLAREDLLRPTRSYTVDVKSGDPARLLGAAAGRAEHFVLRRIYRDGRRKLREWQCESLGRGSFALEGQTLGTERYSCLRSYRNSSGSSRKDERLITYAPSLNLIVALERTKTKIYRKRANKTTTTNRTLKHLLAPQEANAKRIRQIHRQLAK
ncbi:hypothetical protein [Pseudomonas sp. MBLB4136]|uniref:hypothetical protein n=1 Tax=Pseudomonas sp. MBLB4136 TaxID=3451558 RepID=UPI003F753C6B